MIYTHVLFCLGPNPKRDDSYLKGNDPIHFDATRMNLSDFPIAHLCLETAVISLSCSTKSQQISDMSI